MFVLKLAVFFLSVRIYLSKKPIHLVKDYMAAETRLSVLALALFLVDVYVLDLKYYLASLTFSDKISSLAGISGLFLFLFYLTVLWFLLRKSYESVFGVKHRPVVFITAKLKLCISLVLPWLILSLLHDLLLLIPWPSFRVFMLSPWGDPVLFVVFLVAAVIWLPVLLIKLWGCVPLPPGPVRSHIENFCLEQGVSFKEICYWPLFEGKLLTAGVMGIVANFRYLMITPALQEALTAEELESVVAHEIGHVKKRHLLLYLLLFLGFGIISQLSVKPILYLLFGSEFFYELLFDYQGEPGALLATLTGVPLILLTLLYFRYVFGYFMRNFERQADLHAFRVMGGAGPLVRVFEKIAWLSGKVRDLPSWHHFGIGQRIDYLLECGRGARNPGGHDLKVYGSIAAYLVVLAMTVFFALQITDKLIEDQPGRKFAESVLMKKLELEPDNPTWHQFLGDLRLGRGLYTDAIAAYEKSLALEPENPEVLNNLAWLLLTVDHERDKNRARALDLALQAVKLHVRGYILDTLAEAYWQNGLREDAIKTGRRAMEEDPENREYYRQQVKKFEDSGSES
ncbi:MAG: M48 family metalloprotease [Proteobacteria bacterium]|nr:M48 family metalloprotease [Pseudomonadota bacterium]MBU1736982.1 M48 family metalloprotease [Pseudomonadota bacterium]